MPGMDDVGDFLRLAEASERRRFHHLRACCRVLQEFALVGRGETGTTEFTVMPRGRGPAPERA